MCSLRLRILLLVLLQLIRCSAELVCDYEVDVIAFDGNDGYERTPGNIIQMLSINVGFGTSGVASIDIANPACIAGSCPVLLKGENLNRLLPDLQAGSTYQDVLCYFGPTMPCSNVPINIRTDELACGSPTLPAAHGIVPFGVLVLGPQGTQPGTLYVATNLEMNFYDTLSRPVLLRLEPPWSDVLEVPSSVTVVGANFGPGRVGVPQPLQCVWDDEAPQVRRLIASDCVRLRLIASECVQSRPIASDCVRLRPIASDCV